MSATEMSLGGKSQLACQYLRISEAANHFTLSHSKTSTHLPPSCMNSGLCLPCTASKWLHLKLELRSGTPDTEDFVGIILNHSIPRIIFKFLFS
jgi:hypothetical protein